MKMAHGNATVSREVEILKKIKNVQCPFLPELVWAPEDGKQFGIIPVGKPIDFEESSSTFRNVVNACGGTATSACARDNPSRHSTFKFGPSQI